MNLPSRTRFRRGQALLMVTFSLVALMGITGLAIDIGWAYFIKKSAQAAADAAAMAGVNQVIAVAGNASLSCGTNVTCQPITACPGTLPVPPTNNIQSACEYAKVNGFVAGGLGGRQNVTVAANTTTPPPTAPGVNGILYWMTVRATQSVPQLFASVLGDMSSTASARATAVITQGTLAGSLYLLNRQNDVSPVGTGVDLANGGSPTLDAPGGIMMSSTQNGSGGNYAGSLQGSPSVVASNTYIRGAGSVSLGGASSWTAAPQNGFPDGTYFHDPMGGLGQPPAPTASDLINPSTGLINNVAVPNGCLNCLAQPLKPGQYYAVDSKGNATGALLTGSGTVTFSSGTTTFGNYVFYGGLSFPSTHTTATFAPGRYVLAGVQGSGDILSFHTQVTLQDNSTAGVQNTDAGEIFIFTNANYPGLASLIPPKVAPVQSTLGFGDVNLQAGHGGSGGINFHGLNRNDSNIQNTALEKFAPTVFWQDQGNSRVKYDASGNIDVSSCGAGHTLDSPCLNAGMASSNTPGMTLQATPSATLYGLVYQPRGAWLTFQGSGSMSSPMVFITGALSMQGSATMSLLNSRDTLRRKVAAMVE